MEARTVGLVPTFYRSLTRQPTLRHAATPLPLFARHISSTPFYRAGAQKPSTDEMPSSASASSSSQSYSSMIDQALDFTKRSPNTSQGRTSHYASSTEPASQKSKSPSSLDDLAASFGSRGTAQRNAQSSSSTTGFDIASMLDPKGRTSSLRHPPRSVEPQRLPDPLPAYGPSVGRTVAVDTARGMDVGRAFRSLEMNCGRNKVRADFNRQRFHERPGLKRKRLRSERWRRRFREGFRGMVKMVNAMKKQGW